MMISDKINFKANNVLEKMKTFCNDERFNLLTMLNNSKCDCTEHRASKYMRPKLTKEREK